MRWIQSAIPTLKRNFKVRITVAMKIMGRRDYTAIRDFTETKLGEVIIQRGVRACLHVLTF